MIISTINEIVLKIQIAIKNYKSDEEWEENRAVQVVVQIFSICLDLPPELKVCIPMTMMLRPSKECLLINGINVNASSPNTKWQAKAFEMWFVTPWPHLKDLQEALT